MEAQGAPVEEGRAKTLTTGAGSAGRTHSFFSHVLRPLGLLLSASVATHLVCAHQWDSYHGSGNRCYCIGNDKP